MIFCYAGPQIYAYPYTYIIIFRFFVLNTCFDSLNDLLKYENLIMVSVVLTDEKSFA